MISAKKAQENAVDAVKNAFSTKIFKHAVKKLEESINDAASRGKFEICFNNSYFDIRPFSSLEKDEYATEADRAAIKKFMEMNGYTFFYHKVLTKFGRVNSCFTCRW